MNHSNSAVVFEGLESRPLLSAPTDGLSPAQVRHAYGFDQVSFIGRHGKTIPADGRGQTIAIIDAYHDPTITNDLKVFDKAFGLPDTDAYGKFALTQMFVDDGTHTLPPTDAGWSQEIALDVEWAHAIAPRAHILLVEARSADQTDLLDAVDWARRQAGVVTISMSWGASESPFQLNYDSYLTTPPGHIGGFGVKGGVTYVSSSGDFSAPATWPATSRSVVAIGGTTLTVDSHNNWKNEVAWAGSGGGPSYYEGTNAPDVAYDADPNSGFSIYDKTGSGGWQVIGGTSAGAPQWSALLAIADQGRSWRGMGSLDGATQTLNALYLVRSWDFHDIVAGSNGYRALPGYDLVTGRGSPVAKYLIPDLVNYGVKRSTRIANSAVANSTMTNSAVPATALAPAMTPAVTWSSKPVAAKNAVWD